MDDWIDEFLSVSSSARSPYIFRLWTALGIIASVLERKIWTEADQDKLYPNLYTVLCGDPASGKTIMVNSWARKLLAPLPELHLASDNPTEASFKDELERAAKISFNGLGTPIYSALTVLCLEFGVMFSKYDAQFLADLSTIYDNPPVYSAPRRQSKSVNAESPTINMLIAATPIAISESLPESAWGQGFTSRIIFVWGTKVTTQRDFFSKRREVDLKSLQDRLAEIYHDFHGELVWEKDAQDSLNDWINSGMQPVPTYGRLVHYVGRRELHMAKLAMISSVSAGRDLRVEIYDLDRARTWLFEAEKVMPDVFRAMVAKSDDQLLRDFHHDIYAQYSSVSRDKRIPVPEAWIWDWFRKRTTSERISGLIETAHKSGLIRPGGMFGKEWIPMAQDPRTIKPQT